MNSSDCIFYQLAKTNQAAMRFWSKRIIEFNVTPVQGMVLNFLMDEDGVTSKNLGDRVLLDSATLTGVLDRLEAMDLTERRPNPGDRRAILVCLTGKGRALTTDIRKVAIKANKKFLKVLNPDDEKDLRQMLHQLREA